MPTGKLTKAKAYAQVKPLSPARLDIKGTQIEVPVVSVVKAVEQQRPAKPLQKSDSFMELFSDNSFQLELMLKPRLQPASDVLQEYEGLKQASRQILLP